MSLALASDDGTVAVDSIFDQWGKTVLKARATRRRDFQAHALAKDSLRAAGFERVMEITYQLPIGDWSDKPRLQEIGRWNLARWREGIEGWSLAPLIRGFNVNSLATIFLLFKLTMA